MGSQIWVMSADGSGKRRLTSDARYGDSRPEWNRDGKRLRFERVDANYSRSLWEVGTDGKGPKRIKGLPRNEH